jgi:hypothetical protein
MGRFIRILPALARKSAKKKGKKKEQEKPVRNRYFSPG